MSNIDKQWMQQKIAGMEEHRDLFPGDLDDDHGNVLAALRIALASLELERGMIRRFDLDMSDCDSCGQDCGADMVEDLDGEYVLWDEVLPHLYRHDDYTAQPAQVYVEDLLNMAASAIDDLLSNKDRSGAGVWADMPAKLRRAAMLQGADVNSPVIPDGWVLVPMKLTAENGAKGALLGEFSETKFINCPECFGDDECDTCDGSGRIETKVQVSWTNIKAIWAKGIEHFSAAPQQE